MRLGILSDSHRDTGRLSNALMHMEADGPVDALLFLGDGYNDIHALNVELPAVYQVSGNCDMFVSRPRQVVELGGRTIFMTHGHYYDVKKRYDILAAAAKQQGASIALFGHTHRQYAQEYDGILLINPGAVCSGQFAVLTLGEQGETEVRFYN